MKIKTINFQKIEQAEQSLRMEVVQQMTLLPFLETRLQRSIAQQTMLVKLCDHLLNAQGDFNEPSTLSIPPYLG